MKKKFVAFSSGGDDSTEQLLKKNIMWSERAIYLPPLIKDVYAQYANLFQNLPTIR